MKPLIALMVLASFLTIIDECHYSDMFDPCACKTIVKEYQTKDDLIAALKTQQSNSYPHVKAYKVEPLEYELEVKTENRKRIQEVIDTVEIKREIKFK